MHSQSERSLRARQNDPIEESTEGITLLSDDSESPSESEDSNQDFHSVIGFQDSEIHPNNNSKIASNKNNTQNDSGDDLIFEPTEGHSVSGSQNNSKSNEGDEKNLENRNKILNEISYNDTLQYLQDMLGQTYLNNLSKNSVIQEPKNLPPKIESSSTCVQSSIKTDSKFQNEIQFINKLNQKQKNLRAQKVQKVPPDGKINPFSKKVQKKPVASFEEPLLKEKKESKKNKKSKSKDEKREDRKRDLSTNRSVSKIKRKEEGRDKSATKTVEHKRETKNNHSYEGYQNYQQPPYYPHPNSRHSDSSSQPSYPQYPPYPPPMGYLAYQQMPPYYNYKNYPQQNNDPYYKQALYNGPGQYYIPNHKRKKEQQERDYKQQYEIINGWYYPNRGNVMYDRQERPWVVEGQMSIEDRYFNDLMKRQYLTTFERESLARYMDKRQYSQYMSSLSFYPSPYEHAPSITSMMPNDMYHQGNSLSEPSNNSQISTKTTPLNPKVKNHDNSAREQPVIVQPKVNEVKVASKQQSVKMVPHQEVRVQPKQQEYAYQPRRQAPQKQRPQINKSQKYPSQILPPDILKHQPFLQQSKTQQPPMVQIKETIKQSPKSEVFLLYNVPIIVSNEELKNVSAQIYLVPYSHLMIQDGQPSKWIEYIQKLTGIDVMRKLTEMNEKEVREKGRNIPEGTLSKIKLSRRINFSSMYFIKLTNFLDAESKKPYGQTLFKDALSKIVESFIGGVGSGSTENTLLIHGGYFPGVQRELTPKLLANFMYVALANAILEFRNHMRTGMRIIINVSKQEEYYEYLKYFKKVLVQYRKLNAIEGF